MQTCTRCHNQSFDNERFCRTCGSDLLEFSEHAVALKNLLENPQVIGIRISVDADACPVCTQARGSYMKDQVPRLPVNGCSHPRGCRCAYEPWLKEIHP